MTDDVTSLRAQLGEALERERALTDQLQHRVRNLLAVIRSVLRRTIETGGSPEEFASHFQGRLDAIAFYQADRHELHAIGIEVEDIVRDQLLQAACGEGPRLTLAGPKVVVKGVLVELFTLAVHELVTNSIKFGALSGAGNVALQWSLAGTDEAPQLLFLWTETGVAPLAAAPRTHGFGRQLIEEGLPYQLGATTSFELRPGGLRCSILLPLAGDQARDVAA